MISNQAEDILEEMWIQIHEKNSVPDISILKNNHAFIELLDKGYVSHKAKKIFTKKGLNEGVRCVRRHRLAERLLVDVLRVKSGLVHKAGCELEHILHYGIEDNICTLLGHPRRSPDGKQIPLGDCCKKKATQSNSLVVALSEMKKGQKGKIAYIHTQNTSLLNKIMAMGALPGISITLLQRFPSFVFKVGQSQFAIDKKVAEQIQVWLGR